MKKIVIVITFMITFILNFDCYARQNPPTSFNTYDGIEPGGRPLGMGLAFCAIDNDSYSAFFNPAGLSKFQNQSFTFTYEIARQSELETNEIFSKETLKNNNLIFLGFITSKGALFWRPLSDITIYNEDGESWSKSEIKINAYTASASNETRSNITTGMSLSYLYGRIATAEVKEGKPNANISTGNGFTMDLGFIYNISSELKIGANLKNLLGFIWWDDYEKEQLPFILRTGFSFNISKFLIFSSDWEKRFYRKGKDGPISITHFGLEQSINKMLSIRCGIYGKDLNDLNQTHITAGLGYQKNDYCFSISGEKYRIDGTDVYRYIFSFDIPMAIQQNIVD